MNPKNLKTKIFLDGGDPTDSRKIIKLLGFIDGQTTNPTLIAKNPEIQKRLNQGKKFDKKEVLYFYHEVVKEISFMIPDGSVSVEVYADKKTTAEEMLKQGQEMFSWIPNAHIKFPITKEGITAAEQAVREGIRVNMTLCFTQEQAAAVYAATKGAQKWQVFISPFVGRLDDQGENGMGLMADCIRMYEEGDGHVEILTASVRNIDHLLYALQLGSDIITAPFKVLEEWHEKGLIIPGDEYRYESKGLKEVPYKELNLNSQWQEFNIAHKLTDKGLERFTDDWNSLL